MALNYNESFDRSIEIDLMHEQLDLFNYWAKCEEHSLLEALLYGKNRGKARRRHLDQLKANKHAKKAAMILASKYINMSPNITPESAAHLEGRMNRARKKAERIKN